MSISWLRHNAFRLADNLVASSSAFYFDRWPNNAGILETYTSSVVDLEASIHWLYRIGLDRFFCLSALTDIKLWAQCHGHVHCIDQSAVFAEGSLRNCEAYPSQPWITLIPRLTQELFSKGECRSS